MNQNLSVRQRLLAPVSPFFRPIQKIGAWVVVLSAGLVAASNEMSQQGFPIPDLLKTIIEVLGLISGAAAGVATLTVDAEALKNEAK